MHSSRIRTTRLLTVSRSIRLGGICSTPLGNPPGRAPGQTSLDADPLLGRPPGCRPPPRQTPLDVDPLLGRRPWMQTPRQAPLSRLSPGQTPLVERRNDTSSMNSFLALEEILLCKSGSQTLKIYSQWTKHCVRHSRFPFKTNVR